MNRYLFYFERFFNHNESRKFAEKQKLATQAKIKDLVAQGMHMKGVDFLVSAVELVIEVTQLQQAATAYSIRIAISRYPFIY